MERVTRAGLAVAAVLADFIESEALPGTGVTADDFWAGSPRSWVTWRRGTGRC